MRKYRIYRNEYGKYQVYRKKRFLPVYQSINQLGKPGVNMHATAVDAEKWLRKSFARPRRVPVKELNL